jgi:hypothetical protein
MRRRLLLITLFLLVLPLPALAAGDPNIDGGGGTLGGGSVASFWTPGDDGIRVKQPQ